jgi:broad specificity phosphatase PhoE
MRHAESEANALNVLAGRIDYPLTARGLEEAQAVARAFVPSHPLGAILSSPLARARQTAEPFAAMSGLAPESDEALVEQDMGIFAGKTYAEAEADPAYERERSRRWDWAPPGGGESYRMIADRLRPFFARLDAMVGAYADKGGILVVTHAVTLRLVRALLEDSLPSYHVALARNAEILEVEYRGLGVRHEVGSHYYGKESEGRA